MATGIFSHFQNNNIAGALSDIFRLLKTLGSNSNKTLHSITIMNWVATTTFGTSSFASRDYANQVSDFPRGPRGPLSSPLSRDDSADWGSVAAPPSPSPVRRRRGTGTGTYSGDNASHKRFNIFQWNSYGIRSGLPSLLSIAKDYHVLCIQETLLKNNNAINIKGFNVYRKDITHPGDRGICTLVRADIKSELVVLQNIEHPSVEFNAVRIECLTSEPVIIVNVYRHLGQRTPASFFRSLLNSLQGYKNLIILGDFNAHHPAWGSGTHSSSGRTLHQIIGEYDLFIFNGKAPTFVRVSSATTSTIDLVLASPSLAPLCSTKTESDTLGSDHFPVITTIGIQACFKKKFYYKIPLSKEMCQDLSRTLLSATKDLPAQVGDDLLGCYDAFINNILEVARSFLPESKRFPRTSVQIKKLELPPWWNEICSEVVRDRKKAIREFLSTPSEENHQDFRRARLNCTKVLLEQKRRGWRTLVNGFNARTPTSQIWALIKSFKRRASQQVSRQQEYTRIAMEAISKLYEIGGREKHKYTCWAGRPPDHERIPESKNFVQKKLRAWIGSGLL
ncbi:PREDICTED: RNA-directed DNA polymerase from mobile element jockey-like [Trachymyrmex cornetzi]|uniref:RNA-directed DNA polymerase from mobile element jockey-like n=1 Tax=Trachymyrmex cornetzi TaxID=471704 RepID=UPI00084F1097|nr:PREDICTED: RNA-directed DNA polymerase from mobile element jockey-like [Trachymyrmex cornetzi]